MPTKNYTEYSYDNYLSFANIVSANLPNSYSEIRSRCDRHKWEIAVKEEISSLLTNGSQFSHSSHSPKLGRL